MRKVLTRPAWRWALTLGCMTALCSALRHEQALGEGGRPGQPERMLILDTSSFWRAHVTVRPELTGTRDDPQLPVPPEEAEEYYARRYAKIRARKSPLTRPHSPAPPENWMQPAFDDRGWWKDPGPFFGGYGYAESYQPYGLSLLCLRGKFGVIDPSQVKKLLLSAGFRGGLVVYLNGVEVLRSHLPEGKLTVETLADDYPVEAYWKPDRHSPLSREERATKERARDLLRVRRVSTASLPVSLLRRGTNILALEVHRSAMRELSVLCGLNAVELEAIGAGLEPNLFRPPGMQVWNANALETVFDTDYGDAYEPLRPIRIVGTPGGVFSGQVVLGSTEPIRELSVTLTELRSADARTSIPPTALQIRYPRRGDPETRNIYRGYYRYRWLAEHPRTFSTLAEKPPDDVSVYDKRLADRERWEYNCRKARFVEYDGPRGLAAQIVRQNRPPVFGAVQPIWLSVSLPPMTRPGEYVGTLRVRAQRIQPITIPVQLQVCEWKLPDPRDYVSFVDFIQSPESLALYYAVPLWSEKHFALITKTFEYLRGVGNKTLYVPLICRTHLGNAESMVRWLPTSEGQESHTHDYSIMERYLDLALKYTHLEAVVFIIYDHHLGGRHWKGIGSGQHPSPQHHPVPVTTLDAHTGKAQEMFGPPYDQPEARAFWRPVAERIRELISKRGLRQALMIGIAGDHWPHRQVADVWHDILPEARWVVHAHARADNLHGYPVGYVTQIYGARFGADPELSRSYGWRMHSAPVGFFWRYPMPLVYKHLVQEWNIEGGQSGIGRLLADFFPVPLDTRHGEASRGDARGKLWDRFQTIIYWGNVRPRPDTPWLRPGPDGAVSSIEFEMLRQGIQETEARIFIERALLEEKIRARLGEKLAARAQEVLDERTRANLYILNVQNLNHNVGTAGEFLLPGGTFDPHWYAASDVWQRLSEKLFTTAAEVAQALKGPMATPSSTESPVNAAPAQ